jgi:D-alanine-D-alanine ligase
MSESEHTHGSSLVLRYEPRAEDREVIRRIVTSTGVFNQVEIDVAVELLDERLAKGPVSGYEFIFAEVQGEVVGYACYGPIALTVGSYDLFWIAVDKTRHARGVGKRLLARCEELIREAGGRKVYAETSGRAAYEPTRTFYHRTQYEREAVLKDFYAPGDDKVVFVKTLAGR